MAEHIPTAGSTATRSSDSEPSSVRPGGVQPVTLVFGLLSIALAVFLLSGGTWHPHWVLGVAVIAIGASMLIASTKKKRS